MKEYREEDKLLDNAKHIHMIGIGGSGMCPLAEILHSKGYELTGSDNNISDPLKRVMALGVTVHMGHNAENVIGADLVVYSAAISADNPELVYAAQHNIPVMERSHLLGALTRKYNNVIGVCGTHGKTTTSSIITQIFYLNKLDPTAVIGGMLPIIKANGIAGKSENMICESCEFVDTFLQLSPDIAVLLNIDNDHLDYFKTMDNLCLSFKKFVSMAKIAYLNGEDELVAKIGNEINSKVVTFGFNSNNTFYAANIGKSKYGYTFDVFNNGTNLGNIELHIPGRHNILNALAAIAVSFDAGVPFAGIKSAIESFTGAGRRFEFLGTYNGFVLADDYAHHPTEIKATLTAAKDLPYNRVIAVFQPFTFSRTALLKDEFVEALKIADKVILTPIMGSREVNTFGIKSEDIAEHLPDCKIAETFEDVANLVIDVAKEGDLVISMGGGDIYKADRIIIEKLS